MEGPEQGRRLGCWRVLVGAVVALASCTFDELAWSGNESFSHGPSRYGTLHEAVRLPEAGDGYVIPSTWSTRGLNFGAPELVSTVVYAGRHLKMHGRTLSVGDISREHGGPSPWHRSHQTGRDVDLLFLVIDEEGKPTVNDAMRKYAPDGTPRSGPGPHFDVKGNWELVVALLDNPVAEVQYIFVQDDLKQLLLDYGAGSGAPTELLSRAAAVMMQPGDSAPHDDHFHVRVFCSRDDRGAGCVDFGQLRWFKKSYKYEHRVERMEALPVALPPLPIHP